MKKVAIFQRNLNIGGIERSLINLLHHVDYSKYEEIISRISDILDRYLLLEKLGIEKVYEY